MTAGRRGVCPALAKGSGPATPAVGMLEPSVVEVVPADKINEAYGCVLASDIRYRFDIDIDIDIDIDTMR